MNTLLTLSGIVIGIISTLIFQYYQSKEILKQTLYKEKLSTYKQLFKLLEFVSFTNEHSFLLSSDIFRLCMDFSTKFISTLTSKDYKKLIDEKYDTRLSDEIRKDLGIPILNIELADLYNGLPTLRLQLRKSKE